MCGGHAAKMAERWKGFNMTMSIEKNLFFDPLEFFNARVEATGMVVDFHGRITRSFTAGFDGIRSGNAIDIKEKLIYNDGTVEQRQWHIHMVSAAHWIGTTNGLVGEALINRDKQNPAQNRWRYKMDIPVGGRARRFDMEDIMTLVEPDRMLALTPMRKFGIKLAYISSEYRRIS
jgi:Protein of unknown function (DUF3833)